MFEEGESVTINPQYGKIGDLFRFSANGFTPHTQLKASIIRHSGKIIFDKDFTTDEEGRIRFEQRPTDLWDLGSYTFKVVGKTINGEKTLKSDFTLRD